jgi:hypothetical protein
MSETPILVPFKAWHLMSIMNRDGHSFLEWQHALDKEHLGPSYTAMIGDLIIGCAGVMLMWQGVGTCWVVLTKEAERYPVWFTRTIKRNLEDIIRAFKIHRLEAAVFADNKRNRKWIRTLGFKREARVVRGYTSTKQDIIRYERIM